MEHPDLNIKAATNIQQMTQLATMFLVMGIPAQFVPTIPNVKLVGEITQGSNDVFIGSIDKDKERQETKNNG